MIRTKTYKAPAIAAMTRTAPFPGSAHESCTRGLTCGDVGGRRGVRMMDRHKQAIRDVRVQDFTYKMIADWQRYKLMPNIL